MINKLKQSWKDEANDCRQHGWYYLAAVADDIAENIQLQHITITETTEYRGGLLITKI